MKLRDEFDDALERIEKTLKYRKAGARKLLDEYLWVRQQMDVLRRDAVVLDAAQAQIDASVAEVQSGGKFTALSMLMNSANARFHILQVLPLMVAKQQATMAELRRRTGQNQIRAVVGASKRVSGLGSAPCAASTGKMPPMPLVCRSYCAMICTVPLYVTWRVLAYPRKSQ